MKEDENDVWVPSHLVGTIRKRLATLSRKATKLGPAASPCRQRSSPG